MPFQTLLWLSLALPALAAPGKHGKSNGVKPIRKIQLGPRPYWLIDQMDDGPLKRKLESCSDMEMRPTAFSISHRGGGTLQFPEHTKGSIVAGVFLSLLFFLFLSFHFLVSFLFSFFHFQFFFSHSLLSLFSHANANRLAWVPSSKNAT